MIWISVGSRQEKLDWVWFSRFTERLVDKNFQRHIFKANLESAKKELKRLQLDVMWLSRSQFKIISISNYHFLQV